ncbi:MAG: DUF3226 domain-containing protein [Phycisphaerae bacterium]
MTAAAAPAQARTIRFGKLLLGEGIEEVRFFQAILHKLGVSDIQVLEYGGKPGLRPFLRALHTLPGFDRLTCVAITQDADDDVNAARMAVRGALEVSRRTWPASVRVEAFLLPDNANSGMLETACVESVQSDPAYPCVDQLLACVSDRAQRSPRNPWKARAHAYLATLERPDLRVGEAAERGIWKFEHSAFAPLVEFVRRL